MKKKKQTGRAITTVEELRGVTGAYWRSRAILTAVELRIFDALAPRGADAAETAERSEISERGARALLQALAGVGLLRSRDDRYLNTPFSARYLVSSSPGYIGDGLGHATHLWAPWSRLTEAVRTGQPIREGDRRNVELRDFILAMQSISSVFAPKLAATLDLRGRRLLLDIGAGPGTYALHFLRKNRKLRAILFDHPHVVALAKRLLKDEPERRRMEFVSGDFNLDEIPRGAAFAWLSQVLHSNSELDAERLTRRAFGSLAGGGRIAIHDFFVDRPESAEPFAALFSLNMLVGTDAGRTYSSAEAIRWLRDAGARRARREEPKFLNGSALVIGEKEGGKR